MKIVPAVFATTDPDVTNSVIRFLGHQERNSTPDTSLRYPASDQTAWMILGVGKGCASSNALNFSHGIALRQLRRCSQYRHARRTWCTTTTMAREFPRTPKYW